GFACVRMLAAESVLQHLAETAAALLAQLDEAPGGQPAVVRHMHRHLEHGAQLGGIGRRFGEMTAGHRGALAQQVKCEIVHAGSVAEPACRTEAAASGGPWSGPRFAPAGGSGATIGRAKGEGHVWQYVSASSGRRHVANGVSRWCRKWRGSSARPAWSC